MGKGQATICRQVSILREMMMKLPILKEIPMRLFLALALTLFSKVATAVPLNQELEEAATLGAALMLCDISSGAGSHGWNDLIMRGANRESVTVEAATEFVEARKRQIISYLNRSGRLDEFCQNARQGRL